VLRGADVAGLSWEPHLLGANKCVVHLSEVARPSGRRRWNSRIGGYLTGAQTPETMGGNLVKSSRLIAIGMSIVLANVLLNTSVAWSAQGATETISITDTHVNGVNQTKSCTLKLTVISHFGNRQKVYFAGYDLTDTGDCRDASLTKCEAGSSGCSPFAGWATPGQSTSHTGYGFATDTWGNPSLVPKHVGDTYSPVAPTLSVANFSEYVSITFDNCHTTASTDCSVALTLTADGTP
jgi:hypothetical protein